ncbi:hypothetical protein DDE19_18815 [Micromonospora ureilytica]|uniref:Uncharacterized protein n=1 Tax=Micromonospora ureilytica TaxID=709868 RepID=A0A3N9XRE6_9ACTN|nr:hypothetical protein DDE19_18815 [Micromonospora ureilytica]
MATGAAPGVPGAAPVVLLGLSVSAGRRRSRCPRGSWLRRPTRW